MDYEPIVNTTRYDNGGNVQKPKATTYQNQLSQTPKRQLKNKANCNSKGKKFRDKSGKFIEALKKLGKGALVIGVGGVIVASTFWGVMEAKLNKFIAEECQDIRTAISMNYDKSQYLQTSIAEDDYTEYTNATLKDSIKDKDVRALIQESNIDPNILAYILTGEADRDSFSDKELLEALNNAKLYMSAELKDDENGKLDFNEILAFGSSMSPICTSQDNKDNLVALVDAMIGKKSIANSKEALSCKKTLNKKAEERIQYNTTGELNDKININENFENLGQGWDGTDYIKTYYIKFHNPRVEYAHNIIEDENASPILKEILSKYKSWETQDYADIRTRLAPDVMMDATKIAKYDEYIKYAALRNDFYRTILEYQANPEQSIAELNMNNAKLDKLIANQEHVSDKGELNPYLKELLSVQKEIEQYKNKLNEANNRAEGLGFGDFSR